jgi:glutamine amidotransferase
MIVIIDYGMGNIGSLQNMIKKAGGTSTISSNARDIENAEKLILPGVGAFDNGMINLQKLGLIDVLNKKVVVEKTPILGVCLGMQLLTKSSEEGVLSGLGWLNAKTVKFKFTGDSKKLKLPHMGWNTITIRKESLLFNGMYEDARFYFVHSYHLVCEDESDILTTTNYGYDFVSAVEKGNIFGVQFHPEKSHKYGLKLIKNFLELVK